MPAASRSVSACSTIAKPFLLIDLSVPTQQFVHEMRFGELGRLVMESSNDKNSDLASCPLQSFPVWTVSCNGPKLGFATRRKVADLIRLLLKPMESVTVGVGVIPAGTETSESFHLINPDKCLVYQELSVFLLTPQ